MASEPPKTNDPERAGDATRRARRDPIQSSLGGPVAAQVFGRVEGAHVTGRPIKEPPGFDLDQNKPRWHGGVFGTPSGPTSEWQPPPLDTSWDSKPGPDGKVKIKIGKNTARKLDKARRPGETDNDVVDRVMGKYKGTDGSTPPHKFYPPGPDRAIAASIDQAVRDMPNTLRAAEYPPGDERVRPIAGVVAEHLSGLSGAKRFAVLSQLQKKFAASPDPYRRAELKLGLSRAMLHDVADGTARCEREDFQRLIDEAASAMKPGDVRDTVSALRDHPDIAAGSRIAVKILDLQIGEIESRLAGTRSEIEWLKRCALAANHVHALNKSPQLNKLGETGFHKLLEAFRQRDVLMIHKDEIFPAEFKSVLDAASPTFVVQHNWAAAFDKAQEFDAGEWRLSYDETIFEFRISGSRVIASVATHQDHSPSTALMCVEAPSGWCLTGVYTFAHGKWTASKGHEDADAVFALCISQIRAMAIALEAEVAVTECVRAPAKLNKARERKGKLPILDYHVVNLARRTRPERLPDFEGERGTHASPRLHFRRGHWRHYENHKSWVRWCLVGDPELGFVDKHYRL